MSTARRRGVRLRPHRVPRPPCDPWRSVVVENTPWRSSFHHLLVAIAGARRSTSRANASARRTRQPHDCRIGR
jgi:hypothetical protein